MQKIKKTFKDIKALEKIQGAEAVAKAIIVALKGLALRIKAKDKKDFEAQIKKAADLLLSARPTEPLAQNAVKFLFFKINEANNVKEAKLLFKSAADEILRTIDKAKKEIVAIGRSLIRNGDNIFTHCHSTTVEEILITAKKTGKKFSVFNTETRPLFQGHITATNLIKAGIDATMVTDGSAGFLISQYSDRGLIMDKLIMGCDAILPDGTVINKIGSFVTAQAAHYEKDLVYIAGSLLKFHPKNWIELEKRPAKEIWDKAPAKLKIINFAFDVVPAEFIEGIICEAGIIKPSQVERKAKELYPWL